LIGIGIGIGIDDDDDDDDDDDEDHLASALGADRRGGGRGLGGLRLAFFLLAIIDIREEFKTRI